MAPPVSTNTLPPHTSLNNINRDDHSACDVQKPRAVAIIHRTSLKGSTLITQCPKQTSFSPSVTNASGDKTADSESMVKQVYRPAQHLQKMMLHTPIASNAASKATGTTTIAERRKLVVVGDGNIGKTCLLLSFTKHTFTETYTPTVFENHIAEVQLVDRPSNATGSTGIKRGKPYNQGSSIRRKSKAEHERRVELALWDTAGQEDYDRLRPLSYPDSDIILLCFAVDTPGSLEHVRIRWAAEVAHFCAGVPMVLVGLKSDLRNNEPTLVADGADSKAHPSNSNNNKKQRKLVSVEEAQDAAFRIGARAYVECSAKSGDGVEDVFARALQEVWNAEREAVKKRRRWLLRKCAIM